MKYFSHLIKQKSVLNFKGKDKDQDQDKDKNILLPGG